MKKVISMLIVFTMTATSYGRSVCVRNLTEWWARDYRDYTKIMGMMEKELGYGIAIYEDVYDLYYIGRHLDWRQYMAARLIQRPENEHKSMVKALDIVDYYLCAGTCPNEEMISLLEKRGFVFYKIIDPRPEEDGRWTIEFLKRHKRLSPLGPYCVWKRMDKVNE